MVKTTIRKRLRLRYAGRSRGSKDSGGFSMRQYQRGILGKLHRSKAHYLFGSAPGNADLADKLLKPRVTAERVHSGIHPDPWQSSGFLPGDPFQ
jgi:hypothetical protein